MLLGGYKCTPEQIHAWFGERGVELREGLYTVSGNRYLKKQNLKSRIRACQLENALYFLILTHKATTDDSIALQRKYEPFKEDDWSRSLKAEMGMQDEDLEFITFAEWAGC